MQVGVMTTDGGPHPHDQWAYTTAARIIQAFFVLPQSPQKVELEIAKDRARAAIYDIMERHHRAVQEKERALLADGDHARLTLEWNVREHTDAEEAIEEIAEVLGDVLTRVKSIDFVNSETGFSLRNRAEIPSEINHMIRSTVYCDLNTVMDIERDWHSHRNPENEHSFEYRRRKIEGR